MNSPGNSSPRTFRHLKYKLKQSPVQIKELMRKVSFCCTCITPHGADLNNSFFFVYKLKIQPCKL